MNFRTWDCFCAEALANGAARDVIETAMSALCEALTAAMTAYPANGDINAPRAWQTFQGACFRLRVKSDVGWSGQAYRHGLRAALLDEACRRGDAAINRAPGNADALACDEEGRRQRTLTDDQVRTVQGHLAAGMDRNEIQRITGVSHASISRIATGMRTPDRHAAYAEARARREQAWKLEDAGKSVVEIAVAVGRSKPWVYEALAVRRRMQVMQARAEHEKGAA